MGFEEVCVEGCEEGLPAGSSQSVEMWAEPKVVRWVVLWAAKLAAWKVSNWAVLWAGTRVDLRGGWRAACLVSQMAAIRVVVRADLWGWQMVASLILHSTACRVSTKVVQKAVNSADKMVVISRERYWADWRTLHLAVESGPQ